MKLFPTQSVRSLAAVLVLLMLSLLPLTGCSKDAEGDQTSTVNVGVPPIYVAQTLVFEEAGEPVVEKKYRQLLKACRDDAGVAITPLSEDEAKKLGRTYYQLWFDDKHTAVQKDTWDFGMKGIPRTPECHFYVKHEASKFVATAGQNYHIDLMARTATREADSGFLPGGPGSSDDDDQLDPSEKELGYQRLGYASDAGQRCLRWRAPKPNDDESCTWSEGHKWGFPRDESSGQAGSYDPGRIVLWVHPSSNGPGGELTTQKMTVGGEPFDDAVFAPPSGVSIKKDGP